MLNAMGHQGPMASIDDDVLDLSSGLTGRPHAVARAVDSLAARVRGTSALTLLKNAYGYDRHAGGEYSSPQRFGFEHKVAVLAQHREELNLKNAKVHKEVAYMPGNTRVCTALDATWEHGDGMLVGARLHTMTTSKAYENNKPGDVSQMKSMFSALYGKVQHDMMAGRLDYEYAVIMEGPGRGVQDSSGVRSVRIKVLPDPDWQRDWAFYYDVLDGVLDALLPDDMGLPLQSAVLRRPQATYKTHGRCMADATTTLPGTNNLFGTAWHCLALLAIRLMDGIASNPFDTHVNTINHTCKLPAMSAMAGNSRIAWLVTPPQHTHGENDVLSPPVNAGARCGCQSAGPSTTRTARSH